VVCSKNSGGGNHHFEDYTIHTAGEALTMRFRGNANYVGLGIALGAGIGTALGTAFAAVAGMDNIAVGISIGIAVGVGMGIAIGSVLQARQSQENNDQPESSDPE